MKLTEPTIKNDNHEKAFYINNMFDDNTYGVGYRYMGRFTCSGLE